MQIQRASLCQHISENAISDKELKVQGHEANLSMLACLWSGLIGANATLYVQLYAHFSITLITRDVFKIKSSKIDVIRLPKALEQNQTYLVNE